MPSRKLNTFPLHTNLLSGAPLLFALFLFFFAPFSLKLTPAKILLNLVQKILYTPLGKMYTCVRNIKSIRRDLFASIFQGIVMISLLTIALKTSKMDVTDNYCVSCTTFLKPKLMFRKMIVSRFKNPKQMVCGIIHTTIDR